jgi:hypothetical protein
MICEYHSKYNWGEEGSLDIDKRLLGAFQK